MTEEVIGVSVISADNEQHGFINANFLISKILSMSTWLDGMVLVVSRDEVIDIIKEMQTVDAVEVVRCKDCIYKNTCLMFRETAEFNDDWYCADGERKEDAV